MKQENNLIVLSATDLSHHLDCGHLSALEYARATGSLPRPDWSNPDTDVLQELGRRHEQRYLQHLRDRGLEVVELYGSLDGQGMAATLAAMKQGVDAIVQAALFHENWGGRADVLLRTETPSNLGPWSYEVYDCKLSCETKAATILQLLLYSDLLAQAQGAIPKSMYVISPSETLEPEPFNVAEYAAYYRLVKGRLQQTIAAQPDYRASVADPNSHCDVCAWWKRCDGEWREQDHLSLVAGISRLQRKQLGAWTISTMAKLAEMPVPVSQRPKCGSREGYKRIREQARLQVAGREEKRQIFETFQTDGLARLPEPNPGDIFFDLEGDYFVDHTGLEYLFGFVRVGKDEPQYECRWSLSATEEKAAFEWFVDSVMQSWREHPNMHVYHFTPREPATLKRLMGRYATREDEVDRMLRGQIFVDLHAVLKQSVRASVEKYALKELETFWNFKRKADLQVVRTTRRIIEHGLELGEMKEVEPEKKQIIEAYNADDCLSTAGLREWLEQRRCEEIAKGKQLPRPEIPPGDPSAALDERQQRTAKVSAQLMQGVPADPDERTDEQKARALLANLLDWHRRESRAEGQEYFRLLELPEEELLYERNALYGLEFVEHLEVQDGAVVDRYRFLQQETSVRRGHQLSQAGNNIGKVGAINLSTRLIDIEKSGKAIGTHPKSVFIRNEPRKEDVFPNALCALASSVLTNGADSPGRYRAGLDLLLRRPPHWSTKGGALLLEHESPTDAATRIVPSLDSSVLVIQGPPGSGKTFAGAKIICEMVRRGKKVGITAIPHRVIRNLLEEVNAVARAEGLQGVLCLHKVSEKSEIAPVGITEVTGPTQPLKALQKGTANVVGGTQWIWAREDMLESVDVLVVDEAGQVSLANVLASCGAAKNLVLLGDPQQLDQPLKGHHPQGADISALQHMLGEDRTITPNRGLFLEQTRRLHPSICKFTSELFYDERLNSLAGLEEQRIEGPAFLGNSGLRLITIDHEGNQNAAEEEVNVIEALVGELLNSNTQWFNAKTNPPALCSLTKKDILIIAPYNAQVSDLSARLPGIEVGTVDRFQGREAAIVIYSLTTSSPEDAPRGMEFLYSLNRLNVATSRGRAMCIVVASPRLLEPQCRTPRQMQLANALCRYAELAKRIEVIDAREDDVKFRFVAA